MKGTGEYRWISMKTDASQISYQVPWTCVVREFCLVVTLGSNAAGADSTSAVLACGRPGVTTAGVQEHVLGVGIACVYAGAGTPTCNTSQVVGKPDRRMEAGESIFMTPAAPSSGNFAATAVIKIERL